MQSKELKSRSLTCSSSFHAVKRERHHEYTMISLDLAKYEQLDASRSKVINRGSDKRREYDADTGALEMLDMAGYNPKAMQ